MSKSTFEWQVGGEGGEWQVIAEIGKKKPRRHVRWWVWVILVGTLLVLGSIGYLILRRHVDRLNEQIAFQIQTVIDLETKAWTRNDVNTYLAQQDDGNSQWYEKQRSLVLSKVTGNTTSSWSVPIQARVQNVNVQGNIAWVETHEPGPQGPVRRMHFYRKTGRGWLHTAPDQAFWGQAIEYHYGSQLILRFHKRDRPYIEPLIETLAKTFYYTCNVAGCPETFKHEINVRNDYDTGPSAPNTTMLLSPWISGIPLEGEWGESQLPGLLQALIFDVIQAQLTSGIPEQPITQLQLAIIDEYAAWSNTNDLAQAPLLGRVIARHGPEILPALFAYLKSSPTQTAFLSRWLALTPPSRAEDSITYFETLLNIEQEAAVTGRRFTFFLLQDAQDGTWMSYQSQRLDQINSRANAITLTPIQIYDIQMQNKIAAMSINGNLFLHTPTATIFRLREDGWKHNDFVRASYQLVAPLPTPTPRP